MKTRSILAAWTGRSLVLRIVIGLAIGVALALLFPGLKFIEVFGKLFVGALKAVAPVLVCVLVASSIATSSGNIGRRFRLVIVLYMTATLVASVTAVLGSFLFPVSMHLESVASNSAPAGLGEVFGTLMSSLVSNPVEALANANYLGILFWSSVTGLALKFNASESTIKVVKDFADSISQVVRWIIEFAPFGILGLVFSAVSHSGLEIFSVYGKLLALLVCCMLFSALVVNPLIVAVTLRRNPYPLVLKCLKESGLQAFFTRSSAANIPVNMDLCKRMGVDENFYTVSIPLGATINMNGAAVTIAVMTLSVCHTLGIEVSLAAALFLCIISTLAACGASGVAGGSLLLIPMACSLFGIGNDVAMQAVAVGFIIGVVQDSVETALNSSGDALFTITADRHCNI